MLGGWKAGDDFRTNLDQANKYHCTAWKIPPAGFLMIAGSYSMSPTAKCLIETELSKITVLAKLVITAATVMLMTTLYPMNCATKKNRLVRYELENHESKYIIYVSVNSDRTCLYDFYEFVFFHPSFV